MSRIIKIQAHSRDCNFITFPNNETHDGYVPKNLGIGGGDEINLEIDIDTGKIVGWNDKIRDAILLFQNKDDQYEW